MRVGTHALKKGGRATLWKRLKQHQGQVRSGGGNHRGSIFGLIVGAALIEKDALDCPTWGGRSDTARREGRERERAVERDVSKVIGEMPFLWLAVPDEPGPTSLRGCIVGNAIALLSSARQPVDPVDPPSQSWLGGHCDREKVRKSGLWNSNHVEEDYDPAFLDKLEKLNKGAESPR